MKRATALRSEMDENEKRKNGRDEVASDSSYIY